MGEAAYATSVQLAAANSPNRRLLQDARLPAMQFSDQQPGALQALGKAIGLDTSASSLTPAAAPAAEDSAPPGRRVPRLLSCTMAALRGTGGGASGAGSSLQLPRLKKRASAEVREGEVIIYISPHYRRLLAPQVRVRVRVS